MDRPINYDSISIVTAVSPGNYLKKFERALLHWHQDELLNSTQILIYAHESIYNVITYLVAKYGSKYKRINVVRWKRKNALSMKDEMLSAFIFGTVRDVKTKYWIKLDIDNQLKDKPIQLPDNWEQYCVIGTKWGYTKCKHDTEYDTKGHWLNRLDDFCDTVPDFYGTKPLFPKDIKEVRYGHKRYCSFFCLYRTNFTRHIANILNSYNQGNMIIPSEDTTTWYFVTRLPGKRKVYYGRFKHYMSPR